MKHIQQILNPAACDCGPDAKQRLIAGFPFLKKAAPATLEALGRLLRTKSLIGGEEFFRISGDGGLVAVVGRGACKVFRPNQPDDQVIFDVVSQGDVFLYDNNASSSHQMFGYPDVIQAMTTSCVLYMERGQFDRILETDPKIVTDFIGAVSKRYAETSERFIRFMAATAEKRIAYLLQFLHQKGRSLVQHPNLIPFNLTRKEIANMAGLTLETTSRILAAFEREALIRSGRAWIEILDQPKIAALAAAKSA